MKDSDHQAYDDSRFRAIIENSKDGYCLITAEGNYQYISSSAIRMFGYEATDEIPRPDQLIHPDDLPKVLSALEAILQNPDESITIEYRFRHKNGSWLWIETTLSNMLSVPAIGALVFNFHNITRFKDAEELLHKNEIRFRELLELATDAFFQGDSQGKFILVNRKASELTGYSQDELLKMNISELFEKGELLKKPLEYVALQKGEIICNERRLLRKNGNAIYVEMHSRAMPDGSYQSFFRDISIEKVSHDALQESETRFRSIFQNSPDAIILADEATGFILDANQAAERLLKMDLNQIIGMHQSQLHPPSTKQISVESFREHAEILKKGEIAQPIENLVLRSDGTVVPAEILANSITLNGRSALMGVFRDISQRKLAEKKLQAERDNLSTILTTSPVGMLVINENYHIVNANPAARRIFTKQYIAGTEQLFGDLIGCVNSGYDGTNCVRNNQCSSCGIRDAITTSMTAGVSISEKEIQIIRDSSYTSNFVWLKYSTEPLVMDEKRFVLLVINDVTEIKHAHEILQESEEKYRGVVKNSTDGIAIVDSEGTIIEWNRTEEIITGIPAESAIGGKICDIQFANADPNQKSQAGYDKLKQFIQNLLTTQDSSLFNKTFQRQLYRPDGSIRFIESVIYPITAGGELLLGSISRDITERMDAERALKESELKYRRIIEFLPDAVVIHQNGRIKFANPATLRLLDIDTMELILDKPVLEFVHPDSRQIAIDRIHKVIEEGSTANVVEEKFITPSGKLLEVETIAIPIEYMGEKAVQVIVRDISQRNRAIEALCESEDKFRTLAQSTPYAILIYQDDFFVYSNPAGENITGYPLNELLTMRFWEVVAPEYIDLIRARGQRRQKGQSATPSYEFKIRRKDNEERWVYLTGSTIVYKGRNAGLISVVDITERKLAEEGIKQEKNLLRTLIDNLPDGIHIKDTSGRRLVSNKNDSLFTGSNSDSSVGKTDFELIENERGRQDYNDDLMVIETGKAYLEIEAEITDTEGKQRWIQHSRIPLKNEDGSVKGLVGIGHDITERKQAEIMQKVLLQISNAVLTTRDLDQLFATIQEQLGKLLDTRNFFIAFYNSEKQTFTSPFYRNEQPMPNTWPAEKTLSGLVVKRGRTLIADEKMIAQLEQNGELDTYGEPSKVWLGVPLKVDDDIIGLIAVQSYTDGSAYTSREAKMLEFVSHQVCLSVLRKKAEQDLRDALAKAEESDRLKTAFLNNMSHEIRTPLNGILGFTSLLNEPDVTPEDQKYFYRIINKNGEQLLSIIDDIINIATIEAGQERLRETDVNIGEMFEFLFEQFKHLTAPQNIMLNYRNGLPRSEQLIITDETKLRQILTNLLGNAFKFTDDGLIEFGCMLESFHLHFYVKDSGTGISTEAQELIFDRFRQINPNPKREYGGNGLGLAISKAYVELMGGRIWVESELGHGSTFHFAIPHKPAHPVSEALLMPDSVVETEGQLDEKTILIAEDVFLNYQLIASILKKNRYKLLHASTGSEAIEICRLDPSVDLVLMDMKMPDIDGFDATRIIKEMRRNLPIIAVTAYALTGDKARALNAGCDDYLAKPVKASKLISMLTKYLKN